jgi:hypothetical protein
MIRRMIPVLFAFLCGALFGLVVLQRPHSALAAQTAKPPIKPVKMVHFFTGPDGQTHFDTIDLGSASSVKLMPVTGAELHHAAAGLATDWHVAPNRQYVITLSGRGEIDASDGTKVTLEPGTIELAEDLTGKGHIMKSIGNDDRLTLWLPLADQTVPARPAH